MIRSLTSFIDLLNQFNGQANKFIYSTASCVFLTLCGHPVLV